ncbi:MAG: hypothetical protein Kow00121_68500 [Elainellaceae cyanobacterium]
MVTLTVRPYQGESDLQPIANLLNACEAADREDCYYSLAGLQTEFTAPNCNPERDLRLWHNANGQLVAFGQLSIPSEFADQVDGYLWFRVHPQARRQGLETEIMTWGEACLRDIAKVQGLPGKLGISCRDYQRDRIALFETHGFAYERCFLRMQRSLSEPIDIPQLPEGFTIKTGDETTTANWVEMYNQTFIDHWNFHPLTIEQADHWLSSPTYRPELDLVAIAPDGTYAAFCYGHVDPEENQHRRCREGWISILGTRRGFRRLGLGRSLLLSGLHRLKAAGMDTALLGVDSENPNQAYTLYNGVGFRKQHATFCYSKQL